MQTLNSLLNSIAGLFIFVMVVVLLFKLVKFLAPFIIVIVVAVWLRKKLFPNAAQRSKSYRFYNSFKFSDNLRRQQQPSSSQGQSNRPGSFKDINQPQDSDSAASARAGRVFNVEPESDSRSNH